MAFLLQQKSSFIAGVYACDEVIRFFQGYKEKLIDKEG